MNKKQTGTLRNYYTSPDTHEQLGQIGDGNYSKGVRIAAEFHPRLVEQLTLATRGQLNELEARLLLREIEVAG